MKQETHDKIADALSALREATANVQGLAAMALVMPHGERGQMTVQMMSRGTDMEIAHKFYECMRYSNSLCFDLRSVVMNAAARYLAEQGDKAKAAFDRTYDKCRQRWIDTQEMQAVINDCLEVIDEYNREHSDE